LNARIATIKAHAIAPDIAKALKAMKVWMLSNFTRQLVPGQPVHQVHSIRRAVNFRTEGRDG
jgi:hypothetical protein